MSNGITALVSITRGCDNMCTFCVVPLPVDASAVVSPKHHEGNSGFMGQGFKEITLLGQNVDSYLWYGGGLKKISNCF
jgi:tRNA-2-methylthio-N6-dimethylallyladenosine synthase